MTPNGKLFRQNGNINYFYLKNLRMHMFDVLYIFCQKKTPTVRSTISQSSQELCKPLALIINTKGQFNVVLGTDKANN